MRQRLSRLTGRIGARASTVLLAAATLAGLVGGLAILSKVASGANRHEAWLEQSRVADAVRAERAVTARDTLRLGALSGADILAGDLGSLDQVLLVGRTPGVAELLAGTRADGVDLGPSAARLARRVASADAEEAADMIPVGGDVYDAVALPFTPPVGAEPRPAPGQVSRPVLVGLRRVDAVYLAGIARQSGVAALKLARVAEASSGGADKVAWGGVGLAWDVERPGDTLVLRWTVALVVAAAAIATLIVLRARRAAAALSAREARAVAASRNDWLSGLPNRAFFNHLLDHELDTLVQKSSRLALFHLDIDQFRELASTYGIEAGDAMIQALGQRIAGMLQPGQFAARFEGDAFLILQPNIASPADCDRLANAIQAAVRPPFEIGGATISATVSIGVALAPDDAVERSALVRHASLALEQARGVGASRLSFYKPELQDAWRRRTAVERELRDAIAGDGLVLHFQPIVEASTGRVACVEALVRWQHATEGLIAPDRFIALAEARGLILPLGEWVLREACRAARAWDGARIAVNVSPIQFRQRDFVDLVDRILAETGLDPTRLELELTEGVLVDHEAGAVAAMAALRNRGIRLALDDFGTGYSSLIYLRRFAIDKIKIDKAFIDALEPESESVILVDSVIKLGRALGLTVTAEGVETSQQRSLLEELGCHQLQGYLISRPLPGAAFADFLAANEDDGRRDAA